MKQVNTQVNQSVNRRRFLKGLGIATAGALTLPALLKSAVTAQEFTTVSVYARLAGSPRPDLVLNSGATDAWICLGDEVELFWVTTSDVDQVDLGDNVGVFPADQGGNENGLNWGSAVVQPTDNVSYQIHAIGGDFEAASDASILVFGRPSGEGPLSPIEQGRITVQRTTPSTNTREANEWVVDLPSTQYSAGLGLTFIKPVDEAASGAPQAWNVVKVDEDQTVHRFDLAQRENFQNPFTPAGSNVTIPVAGSWSFTTRADTVISRRIQFMLKAICV